MAQVIAITNQKGGVGKTTTTLALAQLLVRDKKKVLVVDSDPQCNATDTYHAVVEDTATLYDLLTGEATVSEAIQHTEYGDIIACDMALVNADKKIDGFGFTERLKEGLAPVMNDYDYIIIDAPPALGVLLANAISVANYVIIPVEPSRYALKGLSDLYETIMSAKKYTNPGLQILGVLITKYQAGTNAAKTIDEIRPEIEKVLGVRLFNQRVRQNTTVRDAESSRVPLVAYEPYCAAAVDYRLLCKEIVARIKEDNKNG